MRREQGREGTARLGDMLLLVGQAAEDTLRLKEAMLTAPVKAAEQVPKKWRFITSKICQGKRDGESHGSRTKHAQNSNKYGNKMFCYSCMFKRTNKGAQSPYRVKPLRPLDSLKGSTAVMREARECYWESRRRRASL
jgi:hypothetical protein